MLNEGRAQQKLTQEENWGLLGEQPEMGGLAEGNCKAKGKRRHGSGAGFNRRSKAAGLGGQAATAIASRELLLLVGATHTWWKRSPPPTHTPTKGFSREIPAPSSLRANYYGLRLAHHRG